MKPAAEPLSPSVASHTSSFRNTIPQKPPIKISIYAIPSIARQGIPAPSSLNQKNIIIQTTLAHFGHTWEQVNKHTRKREIATTRQVIMYLLCLHTTLSLKSIGAIFTQEFDHTTVIHARETIRNHISTGLLKTDILKITAKINS